MNRLLKKILVLLPVFLIGFFYIHDHYHNYVHVNMRRLVILTLTFLLLYGWFFLEVIIRKQRSLFQMAAQASFYVYVFMVLTLTGYFILFREVSANGWWHHMMVRIDHEDHVNFQLFKMFKIYKVLSKQIIGNFIMLLPLGMFLPLLYKRNINLFVVFVIGLFVSTGVELLQLITSFRSADVDDIFLNTLGACTGYVVYKTICLVKPVVQPHLLPTN